MQGFPYNFEVIEDTNTFKVSSYLLLMIQSQLNRNLYLQVIDEELHRVELLDKFEDSLSLMKFSYEPILVDRHYITEKIKFLGIPTMIQRRVAQFRSESPSVKPLFQPHILSYGDSLNYDGIVIEVFDEKVRSRLERFAQACGERLLEDVHLL